MKDNHLRSLIKGISWRVIGTVDTIFISWLITGNVSIAVKIGMVEVFTKILLFYLHERVWNIIRWGRGNKKDNHKRSFIKGISWRITGTVDTMIISFIITGYFPAAIKIGTVEMVTKLILYYIHERIWILIKWGRVPIITEINLKAESENLTTV